MIAATPLEELCGRLHHARSLRRRMEREANTRREQAALFGRSGQEIPRHISAELRLLNRRAARHARTEAAMRCHLYELTGSAFPEDELEAVPVAPEAST